jgi:hypothetical protein
MKNNTIFFLLGIYRFPADHFLESTVPRVTFPRISFPELRFLEFQFPEMKLP